MITIALLRERYDFYGVPKIIYINLRLFIDGLLVNMHIIIDE